MALKLEYTPEEYISELDRQSKMALALADGLSEAALNWQPNRGKSWSIAQCLDHLAIMNAKYVKALQDAVAKNQDQLEPRQVPIQPSGWFMRWWIGTEEPPPKFKLPAPKKILPPSKLEATVVREFCDLQKRLADFVREWGQADLGDLKVRDPLFPLHLTADTQLLLITYHNRRHLWQAANVKKNAEFPND
jgi:DinB superfamily